MNSDIKNTIVRNSLCPSFLKEPSFDYDPVIRHAIFYLPDRAFTEGLPFLAIDNDTDFQKLSKEENTFRFTAGAIAYGEAFKISDQLQSNMTGKVDLICGDYDALSDLYRETADEYAIPIHVEIRGSDTDHLYYEDYIYLEQIGTNWTFTGNYAIMPLKADTLKPNSRNRMGDLILLALIFIFSSAGLNVKNTSRDKGIKKSFRKILFK